MADLKLGFGKVFSRTRTAQLSDLLITSKPLPHHPLVNYPLALLMFSTSSILWPMIINISSLVLQLPGCPVILAQENPVLYESYLYLLRAFAWAADYCQRKLTTELTHPFIHLINILEHLWPARPHLDIMEAVVKKTDKPVLLGACILMNRTPLKLMNSRALRKGHRS